MDPDYRYYNCNIQCPKLKSSVFQADSAQITQWYPSGIYMENGVLPYGSVLDIAPTALQQRNCTGELTLYMKNETADVTEIVMLIVTKAGGIITQALPYQTVGTFTSATLQILNNTTLRLTTSPACNCFWVWRGV
jgi:hypothetical protein